MKRPSAAGTDLAASKKRKTTGGVGVSRKIASVVKVLKSAETCPKSVSAMLVASNLDLSLGACKEERHEFQARVVEMVSEVLSSVAAGLQASIQAAEEKVAAADGEKSSREAAVQGATASLAVKTEGAAAAKVSLHDAAAKHKAAAEALAAATAEQKTADAPLEVAEDKKERLQSALTSCFAPLKEGTSESAKEAVATVAKIGKDFAFDAALLTSLPSALGKELSERGSFDTLVIEQVETELQKQLALYAGQVSEGASGKADRALKVAEASAEMNASAETEKMLKETLKEAEKEVKAAEDALKQANKNFKQFGPEMKTVQSELGEATAALEELKDGALADFKELAERSIHPPVVVEEPVVEEPVAAVPVSSLPVAEVAEVAQVAEE